MHWNGLKSAPCWGIRLRPAYLYMNCLKAVSYTHLDVYKRQLLQVSLEDAISADEIFDTLMGERVGPRREFIEENAKLVVNLDV